MHHDVYDERVGSFSQCCYAPCAAANVGITEFTTLTKEGAAVEGHSKDPFIPCSVCPSLCQICWGAGFSLKEPGKRFSRAASSSSQAGLSTAVTHSQCNNQSRNTGVGAARAVTETSCQWCAAGNL